jgi:hypothetical protein
MLLCGYKSMVRGVKQSVKQAATDWSVWKIAGKQAQLIAYVVASDAEAAVAAAMAERRIPAWQRSRLFARRAELG